MSVELITFILTVAHLAEDLHRRTVLFNMIVELRSRHVLVLRHVAYITAKFGTMVLSMCLQFTQGLPHDLALAIRTWTSMRKLAEVYTVPKYLVDFLHEVALSLAVRAALLLVWLIDKQVALWLIAASVSTS